MKQLIIDSSELTDSKEYYGHRPNPTITITALVICSLLVTAIVFCSLKKIQITSNVTGVIRPRGEVATITSLTTGTVKKVYYRNGQTVKKGDVLIKLTVGEASSDTDYLTTTKKKINKQIEKLNLLLDGIDNERNPFSSDRKGQDYSYYLRFLEYELALKDALKTADYELQQANTNLTLANKQLAEVNRQIYAAQLLKESVKREENLVSAYPEYEALYQEYVSSLKLKWLSAEKESLKEQTIATAENRIYNLELEKTTIESNVEACKNTVERLTDNSLTISAKAKEKQSILAQIEQLQNQLDEIESQVVQRDAQLKPVTIKATSTGVVNTTRFLTKGDAVSAGMVICTILPDNNEYKVQLYLHNEDVASIKGNDLVRYNLAALPSSKYGSIIGHIENVSKDSIVQEGEYTGYYLADATIDKKEYYDKDGNKKRLQPGMQLEARVILDEKTITHYLMEKIGIQLNR